MIDISRSTLRSGCVIEGTRHRLRGVEWREVTTRKKNSGNEGWKEGSDELGRDLTRRTDGRPGTLRRNSYFVWPAC